MRSLPIGKALGLLWAQCMLCLPGAAWAAHACTLQTTDTSLVYTTNTVPMAFANVILRCTRAAGDPPTLTFRITANNGLNGSDPGSTSPTRRLRLSHEPDRIAYTLHRSEATGIPIVCSGPSNWGDDMSGSAGAMQGTITFSGSNLNASAVVPYCVVVPPIPSGSSRPQDGYYTDVFQVRARYPDTAAGTTVASLINVSMNLNATCELFMMAPLTFNYASFSRTEVTAISRPLIQCNRELPYSVSLSPGTGSIMGLTYHLTVTQSRPRGSGHWDEITIRGRIPAGQSGRCGSGVCTERRVHNLTITY